MNELRAFSDKLRAINGWIGATHKNIRVDGKSASSEYKRTLFLYPKKVSKTEKATFGELRSYTNSHHEMLQKRMLRRCRDGQDEAYLMLLVGKTKGINIKVLLLIVICLI